MGEAESQDLQRDDKMSRTLMTQTMAIWAAAFFQARQEPTRKHLSWKACWLLPLWVKKLLFKEKCMLWKVEEKIEIFSTKVQESFCRSHVRYWKRIEKMFIKLILWKSASFMLVIYDLFWLLKSGSTQTAIVLRSGSFSARPSVSVLHPELMIHFSFCLAGKWHSFSRSFVCQFLSYKPAFTSYSLH